MISTYKTVLSTLLSSLIGYSAARNMIINIENTAMKSAEEYIQARPSTPSTQNAEAKETSEFNHFDHRLDSSNEIHKIRLINLTYHHAQTSYKLD